MIEYTYTPDPEIHCSRCLRPVITVRSVGGTTQEGSMPERSDGVRWRIECPSCGITTHRHDTARDAIAEWERRNHPTAPVEAELSNIHRVIRFGRTRR